MKNYFKKILIIVVALSMVIPVPFGSFAAETSKYQNSMELAPAKLPADITTEEFIKNPAQPDLYTLRSDYRVERNGGYAINYQPYVATVGAAATDEEKAKVNKTIKLPVFPGYVKPQDNFLIDYDTVVKEAKDEKANKKTRSFDYKAVKNEVTIKHVFQDINDFDKYGPKPGETKITETTQKGSVGSDLKVTPLDKT